MRAAHIKTGILLLDIVYAVTLWQYLSYALYQGFGLATVGLFLLVATTAVAVAWWLLSKIFALRKLGVAPWVAVASGAWMVAAAALYMGAFLYSACFFWNAARCTIHIG